MSLEELVARIGLDETARRLGVSVRTVRKWLRTEPSFRGAEKIAEVIKRHLASVKAVATRRRTFRESLPLPEFPNEIIGDESSPEIDNEDDLLPGRPPPHVAPDGFRAKYESTRYMGWNNYVVIGRPLVDVDNETIIDLAASVWQNSGEPLCFVELIFFRYIPFNPIYTGQMMRKQGTWVDWHSQTHVHSRLMGIPPNLSSEMEARLDEARRAAESRLIWIEAINVKTIDQV